jgi:glycosyltransferase involved in cell wall biosynthesis
MKRIAIIVPGGFGTGKNNLGIPVLEQLVTRLSGEFEISVFQLYQVNEGYEPKVFELFGFRKSSKFAQYFRFFTTLWGEHRKKKFDVVHGFWAWPCGLCAVLFGKLFNVKSIVSVLGGDGSSVRDINYGYLHRPLYHRMILWSLHHANEATALTCFLSDNLKRAGLLRDLKVIPFGIDTEMFFYRERPTTPPIRFLHIGNFSAVKDQATLLKAFAVISQSVDSHLTMIGEGDEEANILKLINELGIRARVNVLHHMPYSKLPEYYHASHLLLHTSLSEGQSEVVAEAMSCGLVVCGTNVGLLYDLPDSCISVAVKDHATLAEKIIEAIQDQPRLDSIRRRAQIWASAHDLQWTLLQFEKLYNQ